MIYNEKFSFIVFFSLLLCSQAAASSLYKKAENVFFYAREHIRSSLKTSPKKYLLGSLALASALRTIFFFKKFRDLQKKGYILLSFGKTLKGALKKAFYPGIDLSAYLLKEDKDRIKKEKEIDISPEQDFSIQAQLKHYFGSFFQGKESVNPSLQEKRNEQKPFADDKGRILFIWFAGLRGAQYERRSYADFSDGHLKRSYDDFAIKKAFSQNKRTWVGSSPEECEAFFKNLRNFLSLNIPAFNSFCIEFLGDISTYVFHKDQFLALQKAFPTRLKYTFVEDYLDSFVGIFEKFLLENEENEDRKEELKQKIKSLWILVKDNIQFGNPAIASDVLRLFYLIPLERFKELKGSNEKVNFNDQYWDVDSFTAFYEKDIIYLNKKPRIENGFAENNSFKSFYFLHIPWDSGFTNDVILGAGYARKRYKEMLIVFLDSLSLEKIKNLYFAYPSKWFIFQQIFNSKKWMNANNYIIENEDISKRVKKYFEKLKERHQETWEESEKGWGIQNLYDPSYIIEATGPGFVKNYSGFYRNNPQCFVKNIQRPSECAWGWLEGGIKNQEISRAIERKLVRVDSFFEKKDFIASKHFNFYISSVNLSKPGATLSFEKQKQKEFLINLLALEFSFFINLYYSSCIVFTQRLAFFSSLKNRFTSIALSVKKYVDNAEKERDENSNSIFWEQYDYLVDLIKLNEDERAE